MAFLQRNLDHLRKNNMPEINKCLISQGFGLNGNPSYAAAGQLGHTGIDEVCGYGTPVYALKKGWVYKILDANHPAMDGSGYWGVFMISEEDGQFCEWQVGHLSKILCNVGDRVEPWTVIGEEGNRGTVYTGGIQITKAMQDAGDQRASHRHWNKKILYRRDPIERENTGGQYVTAFSTERFPDAYQDENKYFYQVKDFRNGYNGSVDCMIDLDKGYAAINKHNIEIAEPTPEEKKIVEEGIKTVTWAMKYPVLWGMALNILKGLSALLGRKR